MLTRVELEQLATYHTPDFLITSLYLNLDKGRPDEARALTRLKNVLTATESQRQSWTRAQAESVDRDLEQIRAFIRDQQVRGGQGLVVFSCSGAGFWQAYTFPQRVGNIIHFDHQPYTKPLFRWLAEYEPICTVLVGKEKARIFLIRGGEIVERTGVLSEIPKHHEQGGWAQARLQRKHDEAVGHHFKTTADHVFDLFQEQNFSKLVLAGPEELVSEFQDYLHPYVRERQVATFPLSMVASAKTVRARTEEVIRQIKDRQAAALLDRLENEVGAQNMGVAGLRGTLQSLQNGQVQTLILHEGCVEPGQQCNHCGHLTLSEDGACPYCGGPLTFKQDIVEELADRAFEQGCEVAFLDGAAADRLEKLGNVGALLRFRFTG